ncbi:O-methyltransferase glim [Karstenula rhodostoma CBS 690.94]|uniref:O-methyltransferase glim n=1 Tax=Karstenula rhodostoma CBS 690.94 TaxID=1392251 RepID=A0A9P4UE00_9PLEO|nr:O-methyltransferase glim [Karstenula rhodostoma CBS 690.94]
MENMLQDLIRSLRATSQHLKADNDIYSLLHDTEKLPNVAVHQLANEALDLLSDVRLLLEPGHLVLADHFLGYMKTKCLCAAVQLGISDILISGPKPLHSIAETIGSRSDRLGQIMRTLYNEGIYAYDPSTKLYSNNHVSTLLQTNHWTQWHTWVTLYGNEFYDMARGIPLATGKDTWRSPAQINYGTDDSMFTYFTQQGWVPKLHQTLSSGAIAQAPGILEDYPWNQVAECSFLDIGGGGGGLVVLLLRKYEKMHGGILDLPEVIEQAKLNFHSSGGQYRDVGDRVPPEHLVTGDFLEVVPSSEVYTMKWCLHDWDDEKAAIILRNIRRAVRRTRLSRLVILESLLRDGHTGRISRYGDLNMMVAVGGQERDEDQWIRLATQTGWKVQKIYPLRNAWTSAIEFVPVWDDLQS